MSRQHRQQFMAEAIGSFFLVFFGCGAIVLSEMDPQYSGSFIPLIFGGTVSIMIYSMGHISGAHLNPAVTLAFALNKQFPWSKLLGYWSAQFLGALLASTAHLWIWGGDHSFGSTFPNAALDVSFFLEGLLSFVLMFVIMSVATDARAVGELAGLAIGFTVALCAFVGGPLTGASMNPARSFAPALLSGDLGLFWLYLLAPFIGAALGAWAYQSIRCDQEGAEDSHGCC